MDRLKRYIAGVRQRSILSLLMVAMIPICCVLVFFYNYSLREMRADVEQINMNRVSQIQNGFERELMSHLRLRQVLCEDNRFLTLVRRGGQANLYDALTLYREYLSYRDSSSDASVMICDVDKVIHRTGISSGDAYFKSILQVDIAQAASIRSDVLNMSVTAGATVIPVTGQDGEQGLLCLYQMPAYSRPDIVLMVSLSLNQVRELFAPLLNSSESVAFILNASGQLIFAQNQPEGMAEALATQQDLNSNGVHSVSIGENDYTIISSSSDMTGLTYGVAMTDDVYHMRVIKYVTAIWQIVALTLVLCMGAILLISRINYRPVRDLLRVSGSDEHGAGNEFDAIKQNILDTQNRMEHLMLAMEVQKPYVLERLLEYVLTRQMTPEGAAELFEGMNLRFDQPCFFVISMRALPTASANPQYSQFRTAVIEEAGICGDCEMQCYCIESIGDDKITIVVNCTEGLDRRARVEALRERLTARLDGARFTMGVGSMSKGFAELKNSLYEANVLVEHASERPLSFSDEIEYLPGNFRHLYPVKDMMLFLQQLRQGDEGEAMASFDRLCEGISQYAVSHLIFRHVCSYIVNSLAETARQLTGDMFISQIEQLMSAVELNDFKQASCSLIHDFCTYICTDRQRTNSRLRTDMVEFITSNYADPNMGLEHIAEQFGLSPYYVSRFFRDQHNINLKDYIAELRIRRACELLVSTDKQINDIVVEVGYQSTSSFIRKFKSATGMTPGQYRDACSTAESEAPNEPDN